MVLHCLVSFHQKGVRACDCRRSAPVDGKAEGSQRCGYWARDCRHFSRILRWNLAWIGLRIIPSGEAYFLTFVHVISLEEKSRKLELMHHGQWIVQAYLNLQARVAEKSGEMKNSSSFLKATTTTLLHTINESEKASYVAHINSYLGEDSFLKKYLPLDPASNELFNLVRDGVLLWYIFRGPDKILLIIEWTNLIMI